MQAKIYYRVHNDNKGVFVDYIDPNGIIISKNINIPFDERYYDESKIYLQRVDNTIKSILIAEAKRLFEKQRIDHKMNNKQLSNVDFKQLKKYNKKVYDPNYQILIEQVVSTITAAPLQQERTASEKIRMWLKHVSVIGKGSFGIASKAGINKVDDLLVFKYNLSKDVGITHEYVIGMTLNKLRLEEKAMNFVYTYGGFNCSPSSIVAAKNVKMNRNNANLSIIPSFCHDDGDRIEHLLMENIAGAQTLTKLLKNPSLDFNNFFIMFISIFMSLGVANSELGFTHWDCHGDNILITENRSFSNHYSSYKFGINNVYYIKSNGFIPYIIDYGQASIRLPNGVYLGPTSSAGFAEYRGEPFFLQDIYKIIISTLFDCNRQSRIYTFAAKCLGELFGLTPTEIFIIKELLVPNKKLTTEEKQETFWRRIPPIPTTANDINRALTIIIKIVGELNYDINKILIHNPNKEPKNLLACRASGCRQDWRKPAGVYDNYLDLCYSGVTLDKLRNDQKTSIIDGLRHDLIDINNETEFLENLVPIAKKTLELVKTGQWSGQIVDANLISYSEGGNLSRLIAKLYDQFIAWWSLLEEINDLNRTANCIELEKENPSLYEKILEFIQIKGSYYTTEIITLSRDLKDSISAQQQLITNLDQTFFVNWNLYQYIIELPFQ